MKDLFIEKIQLLKNKKILVSTVVVLVILLTIIPIYFLWKGSSKNESPKINNTPEKIVISADVKYGSFDMPCCFKKEEIKLLDLLTNPGKEINDFKFDTVENHQYVGRVYLTPGYYNIKLRRDVALSKISAPINIDYDFNLSSGNLPNVNEDLNILVERQSKVIASNDTSLRVNSYNYNDELFLSMFNGYFTRLNEEEASIVFSKPYLILSSSKQMYNYSIWNKSNRNAENVVVEFLIKDSTGKIITKESEVIQEITANAKKDMQKVLTFPSVKGNYTLEVSLEPFFQSKSSDSWKNTIAISIFDSLEEMKTLDLSVDSLTIKGKNDGKKYDGSLKVDGIYEVEVVVKNNSSSTVGYNVDSIVKYLLDENLISTPTKTNSTFNTEDKKTYINYEFIPTKSGKYSIQVNIEMSKMNGYTEINSSNNSLTYVVDVR